MAADKPPVALDLVWEHDLVLAGHCGDNRMVLDSAAVEGASPMQALAFALAGCMAMDLIHILKKGRHDFRGLRAELNGVRADDHPRRYTQVALHFTVSGPVPEEAVQRGIELSRDKYCSVWQSMRQDTELTVTFSISPGT
jgi:putative redox protein